MTRPGAPRERGVDWFRLPAAAMVVAIHTAPFSSVLPLADQALTYGAFRIAVPFFLMVTGRYVLGPFLRRDPGSAARLRRFLLHASATYLVATVAYLPLTVYAGNVPEGVAGTVRWLLVDGTFYHLWYYPALLLGLALCAGVGASRAAMPLACVLYAIGLGGDSYWGLVSGHPLVCSWYDALFTAVSYTRNGLFYAPIFLMMGARTRAIDGGASKRLVAAAVLALACVAAEAVLTARLGWQRHSSMYAMLPLAAWLAFRILVSARCSHASWRVRRLSEAVYLIHPAVIVAARAAPRVVPCLLDPMLLWISTVAASMAAGLGCCLAHEMRAGIVGDGRGDA